MTTPTELAGAVGRIREMLCVPGYATAIRDEIEIVLTAFAAAQEGVDLLDWLASKHRLSLYRYSPVYGDDDDQSVEWRVERESGGINDRGFEVVGRGDTPFEALSQARSMS